MQIHHVYNLGACSALLLRSACSALLFFDLIDDVRRSSSCHGWKLFVQELFTIVISMLKPRRRCHCAAIRTSGSVGVISMHDMRYMEFCTILPD